MNTEILFLQTVSQLRDIRLQESHLVIPKKRSSRCQEFSIYFSGRVYCIMCFLQTLRTCTRLLQDTPQLLLVHILYKSIQSIPSETPRNPIRSEWRSIFPRLSHATMITWAATSRVGDAGLFYANNQFAMLVMLYSQSRHKENIDQSGLLRRLTVRAHSDRR